MHQAHSVQQRALVPFMLLEHARPAVHLGTIHTFPSYPAPPNSREDGIARPSRKPWLWVREGTHSVTGRPAGMVWDLVDEEETLTAKFIISSFIWQMAFAHFSPEMGSGIRHQGDGCGLMRWCFGG